MQGFSPHSGGLTPPKITTIMATGRVLLMLLRKQLALVVLSLMDLGCGRGRPLACAAVGAHL